MRSRRKLLAGVLASAFGVAVVTVPVTSSSAAVSGVTLQGRGYGHGAGLSQYGAKGRAEAGQTYQQIVAAYYPGTTLSTDDDAKLITVWIEEVTGTETWVIAEPNMTVQGSNPDGGTASAVVPLPATISGPGGVQVAPTAWRLRLESLTFTVDGYYQGTWYSTGSDAIAATLSNSKRATFAAADGTVRLSIGSEYREHRGVVSANRIPGSSPPVVHTTVTLPMGEYLKSVVPSEMPASWAAAALQAQAVAARTYASYDRDVASRPWWYDTCNTTSCQVYRGTSNENPLSSAAVAATAGRILTWGGNPAFTQFSASNGGYSAAGSQPYLTAASDPYDHYAAWTVTLSAATIVAKFPSIGAFTSLTVLARDGNGPWGGRVTSVRINGTAGSATVSGNTFRSAFGLKSNLWNPPSALPVRAPQRDWNGDGGPDLVARAPNGRLLLYAGRPGATWARPVQIGRGWNSMTLLTQVYNFGGTGKPEIIAANGSGLLYMYTGDGRGGFGGAVNIGHGWLGFDLLVGLNGWHSSGGVALLARTTDGHLYLYPGNGRGRFSPRRDLGTGWDVYDTMLAAGDWDGDGFPDIIAREAATGDLYLFGGDGHGALLGPTRIGHGWSGMEQIVGGADWDRDGRYDLIARQSGTWQLWLYPGNGIGGFLTPRVVGSGWVGYTIVN